MLDIQPLLTEALKFKADDFQPGALAPWQRGDAIYALPSDLTPTVMFYNRDLFTAAGVAEPTAGWTWDNWLANAAETHSLLGRPGVAIWNGAIELGAMVWGNGGELSAPMAAAAARQPRGRRRRAVRRRPRQYPPCRAAATDRRCGQIRIQLFKAQQVTMMPAPSSLASSLLDAKLPFQWGIVPLPIGKVQASPLSVAGLAISARSLLHRPGARFRGLGDRPWRPGCHRRHPALRRACPARRAGPPARYLWRAGDSACRCPSAGRSHRSKPGRRSLKS